MSHVYLFSHVGLCVFPHLLNYITSLYWKLSENYKHGCRNDQPICKNEGRNESNELSSNNVRFFQNNLGLVFHTTYSCIFHSCYLLLLFPLLHFHPCDLLLLFPLPHFQSPRITDGSQYRITMTYLCRCRYCVAAIQVSGTEYVEHGSPIQLMCNATGRPDPPHNVDWYKDGQVVHSDVQRGIIVTKKIETKLLVSVLSIRSARLSNAGRYDCQSSDDESAAVNVHVLKGTLPWSRDVTSSNR